MKSLVHSFYYLGANGGLYPFRILAGLQGEFYRQFALTIAISTILSAINSLTLSLRWLPFC